jgi:mRNA interferase MazF
MPIERSEIYFVNLNPVAGREQAGNRPVLVLSRNAINKLPLVVTVVVGTKGANISRDYPTNVRVSPEESGCRWKLCSCAFKSAHSIPRDSREIPPASWPMKLWKESRMLFGTASICDGCDD